MAEEKYYTITQVAEATNSSSHDIHNVMRSNSDSLQEGVHYIYIEGEQVPRLKACGRIPKTARGKMKLLTEKGYEIVKGLREAVLRRKEAPKQSDPVKQEDDNVAVVRIKAAFYQRLYEQSRERSQKVEAQTQELQDVMVQLLDAHKDRIEDLQQQVGYLKQQNARVVSALIETKTKG